MLLPAIALKPSTIRALKAVIRSLSTHTKAGGLLYRDQRMRYLITWTSPIVYRNEPKSIGIYSIEGR
jgi:hypothetical protein